MTMVPDVERLIKGAEEAMDDDAESIITNERYTYIASIINGCYVRKNRQKLSTSDKIDHIVTNRWLALPIFAVVMWIVYYVSVTTVGTWATDWANDGVFGGRMEPVRDGGTRNTCAGRRIPHRCGLC